MLRGFRRFTAGSLFLGSAIWVADTSINDEWDNVYSRFLRPTISAEEQMTRPRLLVLGTGWGACSFLRKLNTDEYQVTVVSPRNYFMYTPLLAGTTVGTIEPRSIVEPIRTLASRSDASEITFVQAECTAINTVENKVTCKDVSKVVGNINEFDLEYDQLVVAIGAEPNTFNIKGVKENAFFLKEIEDSRQIRDHIADCLETSSLPGQDAETRDRLLHFAVVGGGPSGIEFTAELHDFLRSDVTAKTFPNVDRGRIKISLYEAMPRVLGSFDDTIVEYINEHFAREHINLMTDTMVTNVNECNITIKNRKTNKQEEVPYGTLVWVAGVRVRPLVYDLLNQLGHTEATRNRGLLVDSYLRVQNTNNVWAIGDAAYSGCPPTAQVASQQGKYLGRLFNQAAYDYNQIKGPLDELKKGQPTILDDLHKFADSQEDFHFNNVAKFAYIGEGEAVAEVSVPRSEEDYKLQGKSTYLAWRAVYFSKLLGMRNRFMVGADWLKTHFFGRDSSRA